MRRRPPSPTQDIGIESVEAGIDWITHIADYRRDAELLDSIAIDVMREDQEQGSKIVPFTFMGYRGWRTARIRLGWHSGKALMQASGNSAGSIATRLASSTGRTTRLDAQVTVKLSQSHADLETQSTKLRRDIPRSLRHSPPCIGRSSLSTGLRIGTVGPRTSARYLRCYDKGVEARTDPPGHRWRWELEAKQGLAEVLWRDYKQAEDKTEWARSCVESQWKQSGCSWPLGTSSWQSCAPRAPDKPPADAVRLAAWLRTTVAPTLPRVLTVYSPAELLELLGLSDLYNPIAENSDDLGAG